MVDELMKSFNQEEYEQEENPDTVDGKEDGYLGIARALVRYVLCFLNKILLVCRDPDACITRYLFYHNWRISTIND